MIRDCRNQTTHTGLQTGFFSVRFCVLNQTNTSLVQNTWPVCPWNQTDGNRFASKNQSVNPWFFVQLLITNYLGVFLFMWPISQQMTKRRFLQQECYVNLPGIVNDLPNIIHSFHRIVKFLLISGLHVKDICTAQMLRNVKSFWVAALWNFESRLPCKKQFKATGSDAQWKLRFFSPVSPGQYCFMWRSLVNLYQNWWTTVNTLGRAAKHVFSFAKNWLNNHGFCFWFSVWFLLKWSFHRKPNHWSGAPHEAWPLNPIWPRNQT